MSLIWTAACGRCASRLPGATWVLVGVVLGALLGGCERAPTYSQKSPDDVVESALAMVRDERADLLPNLVYAESPEMRSFLTRLGSLAGQLQMLAEEVRRRMPEELAALRDEALASGVEAPPLADVIGELQRPRERSGPRVEGERDIVQDALGRVMADPYGWLERNAERLSTVKLADDVAAVLLDQRPILPPLGLTMRRDDDGAWYVVLPLSLPPIGNFMPRTKEEWSILGSIVAVLENVARELTDDVRAGRVRTIGAIGDKAVDKALFPALLAFGAYGREMDVRQQRDGLTRAFRQRLREWSRKRGGKEDEGRVAPSVVKAIEELAPEEIAQAARRPRRPRFARMSDGEFTQTVQDWLTRAGVGVDVALAPAGEETESVARAWLEARERAEREGATGAAARR